MSSYNHARATPEMLRWLEEVNDALGADSPEQRFSPATGSAAAAVSAAQCPDCAYTSHGWTATPEEAHERRPASCSATCITRLLHSYFDR